MDPMKQVQPYIQHKSDIGITQLAPSGSAQVQYIRQAQPSLQHHQESDIGTTQSAAYLQAAGEALAVAIQVVASQSPEVDEASIFPTGIVNDFGNLVQKGYLLPAHAYLVKGFLATHPVMCLSVAELPLAGSAYTSLAELLLFLDKHCPLDLSEVSVHDKFTDLIRTVRSYNFNLDWVTSVEKRVTYPYSNKEVLLQTLRDYCNEEKEARLMSKKLKCMIDDEQAKIEAEPANNTHIQRYIDNLRAHDQYKVKLASVRERKANTVMEINNLESPFGIRD